MSITTMVGAYSPYTTEISEEAMNAFVSAFENFTGVKYEPLAVAQQVVAGVNYSFFCNATVVYPGAPTYPAMVTIYTDLDNKSCITHIQKLSH